MSNEQRWIGEQQTHQYFELRYPNTDEVDEFTDEGDAQEWAVRMQRQGNTVAIYKRVVEVTKLFGEWEPVPAITPAEAAQLKQAVSEVSLVTEDNCIEQIREVMRLWDRPHNLDRRTALERIRAILDSAPPTSRVLGPEHTYALSVARSAVLKAAGKFVTAADMYRKRDLLRSVQQMADSERACVRVASFLADEIASVRASEERAIPEPTEGQNP